MMLTGFLYALGMRRLWNKAGQGAGIPAWRTACFAAGMASLAVALLSPVDTLGSELFAMHIGEHEVLMLVVRVGNLNEVRDRRIVMQ